MLLSRITRCAFVISLIVLAGCNPKPASVASVADRTWTTVGGDVIELNSLMGKAATVFITLDPECPFCQLYTQAFEGLSEKYAAQGVKVVGVDEAQFFDDGLADLATELADAGVRVIVAGLDQDFSRQPFGPMPKLLALAEMVDKMHAVCVRCGGPAHYSQRIAGGAEQVQVGDTDAYEARCRACYQIYRA